jgi:hypothetical protein
VHAFINLLKSKYGAQFHGAEFLEKTDEQMTDADIANFSLVLVGSPEINAVWRKLLMDYPGKMSAIGPSRISSLSGTYAYAEVFKHPANDQNYVLLIGGTAQCFNLMRSFNPFTATYDCYVFDAFGLPMENVFGKKLETNAGRTP